MSKEGASSEAFERLVRARSRAVSLATGGCVVLLAINLVLMSSASDLGATRIGGSSVTVSLALALVSITLGAVVSVAYVYWANTRLDALCAQAKSQLMAEAGA